MKTIKIGDEYLGEVVSDRYNPLIKRREVIIKISHIGKGTPSRGIVRKAIADAYEKPIECVYVRKIISEFGWGVTKVEAHIYDSPDKAKLYEPDYIIKRNEYGIQSLST